MKSLDRYILKQCLVPLFLILVVTTIVVWMTQTLQRVEIIVEYGQSLGVFAFLSALIIPSLLAIIIPFATFGAAVFALYRLHSDSEIAVMFAAGYSRWRIAVPLLLIATAGALATLYVNVDLMPRSYRVLKQSIADIRADFASTLFRSGEFSDIIDGFTVYVDEALPGGRLSGLLINDYRNGNHPETYMAEAAIFRDTDAGPILYLRNGNIQSVDQETNDVSIIRFEEWTVNVDALRKNTGELQLEMTERYLGELFNPDLSKPYDRINERKLRAEGHNRLASPIYSLAYVMMGLFALIGGAYKRQGYFVRIAAVCAAIFGLRVVGFVVHSFVESGGGFWLLYAIPLSAMLGAAVGLFAPRLSARKA